MNAMMQAAAGALFELVGQNRIMALATRNGEGVASRTVNAYSFAGDFYFVTEAHSNKFMQLQKNPHTALSADAVQIAGQAKLLEHPCAESSQAFRQAVEALLPEQFVQYANAAEMRLVQIIPDTASFISLQTGKGYALSFSASSAIPIAREG